MRIRSFLLGASLLLAGYGAKAQPQYAFRFHLRDKRGTLSFASPLRLLSQRALDRRTRFGVALDSADLPVPKAYVDSLIRMTGGTFHNTSRWLNNVVLLVRDSSGVDSVRRKGFVESATYIAYYNNTLHRSPGDKFASERAASAVMRLAADSTVYGYATSQTAIVNGDALHQRGYRGKGVLVAVLDAGFPGTDTHPGYDSLRRSGRIVDTYDFVGDNSFVYSYDTHGTEVLSNMAGNLPGQYLGAAPDASYALYRTEDNERRPNSEQPIELDNYVAGLERADSIGADIATASLGYSNFDAPFAPITAGQRDGKSTLVDRAVYLATHRELFIVTSAGNDGAAGISTPGDADSSFTIGAVRPNREPASFSSYGPNAAGVVKPDVSTQGNPAFVFSAYNGILSGSGTSYSGPQMAGWVACVRQQYPRTKGQAIRDGIVSTADMRTSPGVQTGYGIPDFSRLPDLTPPDDTVKGKVPGSPHFLYAWPVPLTGDRLHVAVRLDTAGTVSIVLTNITGHTVARYSFAAAKGTSSIDLVLPGNLPVGLYQLLAVGSNGEREVVRVVRD